VAESHLLAAQLKRAGIYCRVLNARNDELEAEIIARAGEFGAVTVSTNMAGRGVDIRLGGGRPEEWARVAKLGGLYVIGTNRHESVRIDNQLRGRAGRQGDPGSSRFFISLEDDLIRRFGIFKAIPPRYRALKHGRHGFVEPVNLHHCRSRYKTPDSFALSACGSPSPSTPGFSTADNIKTVYII